MFAKRSGVFIAPNFGALLALLKQLPSARCLRLMDCVYSWCLSHKTPLVVFVSYTRHISVTLK